jgi:hypothetical protein
MSQKIETKIRGVGRKKGRIIKNKYKRGKRQ